MPAKVPTSAAPIRPPSTSGDWSSAPMALMTPSTAATMPSAGRPSATVDQRVIGLQLVVRMVWISSSISASISCVRALPMMMRRQ